MDEQQIPKLSTHRFRKHWSSRHRNRLEAATLFRPLADTWAQVRGYQPPRVSDDGKTWTFYRTSGKPWIVWEPAQAKCYLADRPETGWHLHDVFQVLSRLEVERTK